MKQSQGQEQVQIQSGNRDAFVRITVPADMEGACLSLTEEIFRKSRDEKVRAKSRNTATTRTATA